MKSRIALVSLLLAAFFALSPLALFAEEQLVITTYYPSPYGSYAELQLYPHSGPPEPCTAAIEGTMYYDVVQKDIYFCDGATWTTSGMASELWAIETGTGLGQAIYPVAYRHVLVNTDTVTDLDYDLAVNGRVFMGDNLVATADPTVTVLINGNGGVSIGYPNTFAGLNANDLVVAGRVAIGDSQPNPNAFLTATNNGGFAGITTSGQGCGLIASPDSDGGAGVYGFDATAGGGNSVFAYSIRGNGVYARTDGNGRYGLYAVDNSAGATAAAVFAWSVNGGKEFLGATGEYGRGGDWVTNGGVSLAGLSDRNAKENFVPVDQDEILAKIKKLPITQWNFKTDNSKAKHIGPISQDFYGLFGTSDEKHIAYIDASGVALAGIKALNAKIEKQQEEIAALKEQIKKLEQLVIVK